MTTTPSGIFRAIDAGTKTVLLIFVGLAMMVGGGFGTAYVLEHPPITKPLIYLFVGVALFGALLLPGILGPAVIVAKSVTVIVQQLPVVGSMFGGKRASDPPAKP